MSRLGLIAASCLTLLAFQAYAYRNDVLPFSVTVNGLENRYAVFGVFAIPNQMLRVAVSGLDASNIQVAFDSVPLKVSGTTLTLRMPPRPGNHVLEVTDVASGASMRLNVLAMWQRGADNGNVLNGYLIGEYPKEPFRGLAAYNPPQAFVEVTAENANLNVSPNFKLGQFVCKQGSGYPKYLVLRPELVQKLETVLGELNAVNANIRGLTVMSGFRTPHYNRTLGNGTYSRHVWGGAADVFVDEDGNGVMDDLNGDGRVTNEDSSWLASFVDKLERAGTFGSDVGGIGTYGSTPSHGPFVHVDARGYRARW